MWETWREIVETSMALFKRSSSYWAFLIFGIVLLTGLFIFTGTLDFAVPPSSSSTRPAYRRVYPGTQTRTTNNLGSERVHHLSNITLAINFNHPYYDNIPLLEEFYEPVFTKIVFCGPTTAKERNIILIPHPDGQYGYYGYQCLAEVIRMYPDAHGYLYVNDDMIVNWWNLMHLSVQNIWIGKGIEIRAGAEVGIKAPTNWHWWTDVDALKRCETALKQVKEGNLSKEETRSLVVSNEVFYSKLLKNTGGKRMCLRTWSDFFYIPARKKDQFKKLSDIFYANKVFLEVSVPTIIFMLEEKENLINTNGIYLPDIYGDVDFSNGLQFFNTYNMAVTFCHPFKLGGAPLNKNVFKNIIVPLSKRLALL